MAIAQSSAPNRIIGRKAVERLGHIATHLVLIAIVVVMITPILFALTTSLKDPGDVYLFPPKWIPDPIRWDNYVQAVTTIPYLLYFGNSVLVTGLDIIGKVFSVTLVAFAFARLRWWGRDVLFLVMLSTLMLPSHVTLIPQFILFKNLNWINTFLPLIVPNFFGGPFLTFLVRQFFMTIPFELDDAARIDGCSSLGVYWRIILPLAKPAMIAVIIFTFNGTWNEFLTPLIYLQSQDLFTLALGLRMFQGEASTSWHLLMAASLLTMLPVLVLFFVTQRYFIQGIVFTGVKS